jgi:HlyD family secretion protein
MHTAERPALNGRVFSVDLQGTRRRPRWWLAALALLVVVAIAASFAVARSRAGAIAYTTVPAQSGSLAQTVTASGTVNPQNTISVGTQVSGTISEINVDYNSKVKKGQVLAKLDPTTLQAALDQAEGQLAQAEAQAQASGATASGAPSSVAVADAQASAQAAAAKAAQASAASAREGIAAAQTTVTKDQSALTLAQQTLSRDQSLLAQGYLAQNQVDTDKSNVVAAQTALDAAKTAVTQAQAQAAASQASAVQAAAQAQAQSANTGVASATAANQAATHDASLAQIKIDEAQVATAKANLAHAVITSPVDGTVIARDVSVGQTVAASLQTPTLFSIAQDLNKMELDLAVGEPDIGRVQAGDPVSFTVLAYPNRTFHGTVEQVRQNPTTVSNVVTYTTPVLVDNSDGALRPGMTANATIQVAHVDNATIVPLAALSYQPAAGVTHGGQRRPPNGSKTTAQSRATQSSAAKNGPSPWGATGASSGGAVTPGSRGRIFVLRNGKLSPVLVQVGLVSSTQATVTPLRGTLAAGDQIVTGDNAATRASHTSSAAGNPLSGMQRAPGGFGSRGGRGGV